MIDDSQLKLERVLSYLIAHFSVPAAIETGVNGVSIQPQTPRPISEGMIKK
jgi:hypothetical protein